MINGSHVIIDSRKAEADRAFFRDALKFPHVDAGEGWLVIDLPPAELGVHPGAKNDVHEFVLPSFRRRGRRRALIRFRCLLFCLLPSVGSVISVVRLLLLVGRRLVRALWLLCGQGAQSASGSTSNRNLCYAASVEDSSLDNGVRRDRAPNREPSLPPQRRLAHRHQRAQRVGDLDVDALDALGRDQAELARHGVG